MFAPDQVAALALSCGCVIDTDFFGAFAVGGEMIHIDLETVHEHDEYPTHYASIAH